MITYILKSPSPSGKWSCKIYYNGRLSEWQRFTESNITKKWKPCTRSEAIAPYTSESSPSPFSWRHYLIVDSEYPLTLDELLQLHPELFI